MIPNERPRILATRCLAPEQVQVLEKAGLNYQEKDFIRVEYRFDDQRFWQALHESDSQARVFTSKNAVHSMRRLARLRSLHLPRKKNFTVGIKATQMLEEMGLFISAKAGNAISLAQIIARNPDVNKVDFFCGDQSLDDLPEYLLSKNIAVNKEIVYHTELVHEKVDTQALNGVIFLSPTAVFSFFKKNQLDLNIPTFCIGATTAEAVRLRCDNPRICANEPSVESTVEKVIEYFASQND